MGCKPRPATRSQLDNRTLSRRSVAVPVIHGGTVGAVRKDRSGRTRAVRPAPLSGSGSGELERPGFRARLALPVRKCRLAPRVERSEFRLNRSYGVLGCEDPS
jgi:hypothetical protein